MSSLIVDVAAASACSAADAEVSRGALMVCDAAGSCRPATADEVLRHARQVLARRVRRGVVFDSPALVKDYLKVHLSPLEYEVFMVVFVDAQHRLIACELLFRGTLSQTSVYPREVVKRALVLNAGAVVLAHNHPSGSVEPSRADELLTQTLKSALQLVDVRVLDHIIVAGDATTSFAELGLV